MTRYVSRESRMHIKCRNTTFLESIMKSHGSHLLDPLLIKVNFVKDGECSREQTA